MKRAYTLNCVCVCMCVVHHQYDWLLVIDFLVADISTWISAGEFDEFEMMTMVVK